MVLMSKEFGEILAELMKFSGSWQWVWEIGRDYNKSKTAIFKFTIQLFYSILFSFPI
jgi:hypothetical protein